MLIEFIVENSIFSEKPSKIILCSLVAGSESKHHILISENIFDLPNFYDFVGT